MPRDWRFRIEDVLDSISKIERYLDGMDLESFSQDDKTIDAVVRNFGIIGEAVRHLPDAVLASHPDLPWHQMRALRNLVIHQYFGVSVEILWETARADLPPLVEPLRKVLNSD
jgi:uncharacterized protein with HEPN domain